MHCAAGGYWNREKDGSYCYVLHGNDSAEEVKRGFDVVVMTTWIAI